MEKKIFFNIVMTILVATPTSPSFCSTRFLLVTTTTTTEETKTKKETPPTTTTATNDNVKGEEVEGGGDGEEVDDDDDDERAGAGGDCLLMLDDDDAQRATTTTTTTTATTTTTTRTVDRALLRAARTAPAADRVDRDNNSNNNDNNDDGYALFGSRHEARDMRVPSPAAVLLPAAAAGVLDRGIGGGCGTKAGIDVGGAGGGGASSLATQESTAASGPHRRKLPPPSSKSASRAAKEKEEEEEEGLEQQQAGRGAFDVTLGPKKKNAHPGDEDDEGDGESPPPPPPPPAAALSAPSSSSSSITQYHQNHHCHCGIDADESIDSHYCSHDYSHEKSPQVPPTTMMTMSHNHSHHHHQSSAPASALSASLAVAAAAASSSPPSQPSAPTTLLPHASPPPSSSSSSSASPFLSYPAKTSFGALNSAFKLGSVADPSTSSSSSLLRIPSSSPSNLAASSGPSSLRRHQPSMPMPIAITDRSSSSSNAIPTAFGPIQQNPCSWTPSLRASFDPSSVSDDEGRFSLAQVVGGGNTSSSSSVPYSSRKQGPARHNVPLARGGIIGPALFEHGVGDDGCPVLTAPRRVFGASGGKLTVPNRVWKKGGADKVDNRHFMIMSYNVLAPLYCTESRYPECHPQFLDWDYRKHKILDEIKYHSPDFVCLQELPPSEFRESFLPELQKLGYDGHFQQKKKAHAADGSAIFYLQARFNLLAVQAFAYSDQIPHDQTSDLYQRLAPFPNVALICVFQNRQARSLRVRVVNTHLHWDPAFTDTKLLQAAILMEWLERTHRDVPTVIAADLNSRPGEVVVDYLVRGKVAPGSLFATRDFGRFSAALTYGHRPPYSGSLGAMSGSPMAKDSDLLKVTGGAQSATSPTLSPMNPPHVLPLLRHGTKLASAYDRKDLPFTNKTLDFEGSIDHILYTSGTLSIRDVLGDFDNSQLEREKHETRSDDEDMNGVMFPVELDVSDPSSSRLRSPVLLSPSDSDAKHDFCGTITEHHHTVRRSPAVPAHASPLSPSTGKPPPYPAGPAPPQPQGFLARVRSLPTENVPSDHLPLCAWLKWKTVPVGSGPFAASSSSSSSSTSSTLTSTSALSTHGPHHHQSFNNDRSRSRGGRRWAGGSAGAPAPAAAVAAVAAAAAAGPATFAGVAAAAAAATAPILGKASSSSSSLPSRSARLAADPAARRPPVRLSAADAAATAAAGSATFAEKAAVAAPSAPPAAGVPLLTARVRVPV